MVDPGLQAALEEKLQKTPGVEARRAQQKLPLLGGKPRQLHKETGRFCPLSRQSPLAVQESLPFRYGRLLFRWPPPEENVRRLLRHRALTHETLEASPARRAADEVVHHLKVLPGQRHEELLQGESIRVDLQRGVLLSGKQSMRPMTIPPLHH